MSKMKDTDVSAADDKKKSDSDAQAEADAKAKADAEAKAKAPKLVRMVFLAPPAGHPGAADVHPDEVENYRAGGWRRA